MKADTVERKTRDLKGGCFVRLGARGEKRGRGGTNFDNFCLLSNLVGKIYVELYSLSRSDVCVGWMQLEC
jgi:hypothetical protein